MKGKQKGIKRIKLKHRKKWFIKVLVTTVMMQNALFMSVTIFAESLGEQSFTEEFSENTVEQKSDIQDEAQQTEVGAEISASEMQNSSVNESIEEMTDKATNFSETIDGITYSWTYDNGVVVMQCSSIEATAKSVSTALSNEHSIEDITELTIYGLEIFDGTTSESHFQKYTKLMKISLPSVTVIGSSAFRGCSTLTSVDLPEVTSVDSYAFYGCKALISISMPKVTSIKNNAFRGCSALTSLELPEVTSIDSYAFYECSALTSISTPKVTTIDTYAFYRCSALTSVDSPEVTNIGNAAFQGCISLISVSLPKVKTMGNNAFRECSSLKSVSLPIILTIDDYTFYRCSELTSLDLPEVTTIKGYAFEDCISLTNISLPKLSTIYGYAFQGCISLTTVSLPKVTTINGYVFYGCSSLTSVFIPNVTILGSGAFAYTTSLKTIDLPRIVEIGPVTFDGSALEVITTSYNKQVVVKEVLRTYKILGIITDAPELEHQYLAVGDSLLLSNPLIINDSLVGIKATFSSSWKKDGEEVGTAFDYYVDSVSVKDAGMYQRTVSVAYKNGTVMGEFSTNEVAIDIEGGELAFTKMPENLFFEETKISSTTATAHRSIDWRIGVTDERGTNSAWKLTATLSKGFSDTDGHILDNSLVYVDANGNEKTMKLGVPVSVFEHTTTDRNEVAVTWDEEQGILLKIDPASYIGEYKGEITWTLVDAP